MYDVVAHGKIDGHSIEAPRTRAISVSDFVCLKIISAHAAQRVVIKAYNLILKCILKFTLA